MIKANYCDSSCMACIDRYTGSENGTCDYVDNGLDPHSDCPGSFGTCAGTTCDGSGSCTFVAESEGGCSACTSCSGSDYSCQPYTDNTQDSDGNNTCTGSCEACQSGVCSYADYNTDPGADCGELDCDGYYFGWSDLSCFYSANVSDNMCDGFGSCLTAVDVCGDSGQGGSSGVTCGVWTEAGCFEGVFLFYNY